MTRVRSERGRVVHDARKLPQVGWRTLCGRPVGHGWTYGVAKEVGWTCFQCRRARGDVPPERAW